MTHAVSSSANAISPITVCGALDSATGTNETTPSTATGGASSHDAEMAAITAVTNPDLAR